MELNLAADVHRRTYRLTFDVAELDTRPVPYSRTERMYAPLAATVDVSRRHDEPWTLYSVELSGRAYKKDGALGLQEVTEKFWTSDRDRQPRQLSDAVAAILGGLNDKA